MQTLAAASILLPDLAFLHVVTMRPSEVCLVARQRPSEEDPEPAPFIVYLFRPVTDDTHLQHFRVSAEKLMKVEHRSLGIPHHFGVVANHPYFFVEIPSGSSLAQLQQAKQLQPAHVVHVIPEVCAALEAAHQQGVNHHSLTPDDIIIALDGSVTILRLGFTDMLVRNPSEKLSFVADTPPHLRHYLAPEQSDVDASTDPRTDIYTIGSILYELFTGRKTGGFFILPSSVSKLEKRVDDLISIALQHQPENRFPTIAEFGTYLTTVRSAEVAAAEDGGELGDAAEYLSTHTLTGTSPFKRMVGIVLSLLVIAAGCTALYFNFVNDPTPDQALVDRLVAMQELDGTKMSDQALAERHAEVGEILGEVGSDKEKLVTAIRVMQRLGDGEATQKVLDEYIDGLPPGTRNIDELRAVVAEYRQNRERYIAAMEEAALARSTGDDAAELAALEKALTFLPDDCHAHDFLNQNPIYLDRKVGEAIALARQQIPPGEKFLTSYLVRRGGVDIDLSDNPHFSDLSIFAQLPIEELDLSNTGTSDLSPLAGMSIRKLWLDDSKVADVSPLLGMPLDTLTFERCAIADPAVTDQFELLKTIRYTSPTGRREFKIPTPSVEAAWENNLGMRFVPCELAGSTVLFSRWETREMDFAEFVEHAGARLATGAPGTMVKEPEGSEENAGVQEDGAGENVATPPSRLPVSGVSLADAREFCKWLTAHSKAAGFLPDYAKFRLPSDHEWSFAAGLNDHPMLSPAVRALHGAPLLASTAPGVLPVAKAIGNESEIHGLWDNVREWTSTPIDAGTSNEFAVRGLYSRPADPENPESLIGGDVRDRLTLHATERSPEAGFRVVLDLSGEHASQPSLPELVAAGEREAAKKLAMDLVHNTGDLDVREAARMYVELVQVETHFKRFRRLPPGLKKHVKYFQGRRYCLVRLPLDWTTADSFSKAIGGHLATLGTAGEMDWVLQNFTDPRNVATIWIGATPAPDNTANWVWQSSADSTNLPPRDSSVPPSQRLLLLPGRRPSSPAPPLEVDALPPDDPAATADPPAPGDVQTPEELAVPEEATAPDVWLQAPGHQRHFFLVEWG